MDLIRKYLLSSVARAPEGAEAVVVDPPAPPPAADAGDQHVDPPAPDPDPPAPPAGEHGNKGKPPWFLTRISEETAAKNNLARENAELRAALERAGNPPAATDPPAARPAPGNQQEFQTAVQREAQAIRLHEDTTAILNSGLAKFPDFNQSLNVLRAVGATNDDFVMDVLAVDRGKAHEIYHTLAQDPEKAAALAGMSSRNRIAELTRMTMPAAAPAADTKIDTKAPAPKQVSKAPPPPPAVDPSASKTKDWRADDSSEEEFTRGFNERMKERANIRR